jgi:4-diphosphocytidyl-2-C-methyl-D-erythritol kinase
MIKFKIKKIEKATSQDLVEWSSEIGSDISFFFSTGTAYCTGRGEIIESLPSLVDSKDVDVHVFKPKFFFF